MAKVLERRDDKTIERMNDKQTNKEKHSCLLLLADYLANNKVHIRYKFDRGAQFYSKLSSSYFRSCLFRLR